MAQSTEGEARLSARTTKGTAPSLGAEFWIEPSRSEEWIHDRIRLLVETGMRDLRLFLFPEQTRTIDAAFDAAERFGARIQATFTVPENVENEADLPRHAETIATLVRRYRDRPALETWWLMNEPAHGPIRTPFALVRYRLWLKEKYGTVAILNETWGSRHADFDSIVYDPAWEAVRWEPRPFYDWQRFSAVFITWILEWIAGEIHRHDDRHGFTVNPHDLFANLGQYEFPAWRPFLTSLGASIHPSWHFGALTRDRYALGIAASCEIIKGSSESNAFWISELQSGNNVWSGVNPVAPEADELASWTWLGLGAGAEKVLYWMFEKRVRTGENGDWSLVDYQGRPTDRLEAVGRVAKALRDHAPFFAKARPTERRATVLLSRESMYTLKRKDSKDGRLARGPHAHVLSALGWFEALQSWGVPTAFRFVEDFQWNSARDHFAVLPHAVSLSPELATQAEGFVSRGNTLVADGLSGYFDEDENNVVQGEWPWRRLFGATLRDLRAKDEVVPVAVEGVSESLPSAIWQAEILVDDARPIARTGDRVHAVRRSFGAGEAIWIPQLVGLGAWTVEKNPLGAWVGLLTEKLRASSAFGFRRAVPGAILQVLEADDEAFVVLSNGSDLELSAPLSTPAGFVPLTLDGQVVSGNEVVLPPRVTVVLRGEKGTRSR